MCGEKFASLNKHLIVKDCQTAIQMIKRVRTSSKFKQLPPKNRKMNFHLKMKLTVNSPWLRLCEPNIKNLKSKWSKRNSTSASSNNCLRWLGEKFASWNKSFILKYCQTAIQMIKRICINTKLEQLPRKIGRWTSVSKWNWQWIHPDFDYVSQT